MLLGGCLVGEEERAVDTVADRKGVVRVSRGVLVVEIPETPLLPFEADVRLPLLSSFVPAHTREAGSLGLHLREGVVARARGVGEVEATRDLVVDRKRVPRLCRDRLVVEAAEALLLSFVVNLDLPLPRRFVPLFKRKAG